MNLIDIIKKKLEGNLKIFNFLNDKGNITDQLSFQDILCNAIGNKDVLKQYNSESVIVLLPQSSTFLKAFISCIYSGKYVVPLTYREDIINSEHFLNYVGQVSKQIGSNLIITDDIVEEKLSATKDYSFEFITINETVYLDNLDNYNPVYNENIACLFTSGSTSTPKGVLLSHTNIINNAKNFIDNSDYENAISLSWLPHYHAFGLLVNVYFPIVSATPVYIMSTQSFAFNPLGWLEKASLYGATHIAAPDFAFRMCAKEIEDGKKFTSDLSKIRKAFSSSEPIKIESFERFHNAFTKNGFKKSVLSAMYGMSEASVIACEGENQVNTKILDLTKLKNNEVSFIKKNDKELKKEIVGCGQFMDYLDLIIIDSETSEVVKDNQIGEICIKGESVFSGYINPSDNENIWIVLNNKKYFHTGDLGFINENNLFITGRSKEVIIINGKNYYPFDIERTANITDSTLKDCRVAVVSDFFDDNKIYMILEIDQDFILKESLDTLSQRIYKNVIDINNVSLHEILFIEKDQIPRTVTGKIQRKKSFDLYKQNEFKIVASFNFTIKKDSNIPQKKEKGYENESIASFIESQLQSLIHKVENIDVNQSFYELGIGSLEFLRLLKEINENFCIDLKLNDILSNDTVTKLTNLISGNGTFESVTDNEDSLSPQESEVLTLSENQKGILFEILNNKDLICYNTPFAFVLNKDIDVNKLNDSFIKLQQAHPILKTRLVKQEDYVLIEKNESINLEIEYLNYDYINVIKYLQNQAHKPIDIKNNAKLFYAKIIVTPEVKILFINGSHLILDGTSFQVIFKELFAFYNDISIQPQPERFFYQYHLIEQEKINTNLDVLSNYYGNAKKEWFNTIQLPYRDKSELNNLKNYDQFTYKLDEEKVRKINNIIKNKKTTKYPFFISLYFITMYRYAREKEITVLTTLQNRDSNETAAVGSYANLLPFAATIDDQSLFEDFCKKNLQNVIDLYNVQFCPFSRTSKYLKLDTSNDSYSFQNLFLYQNWLNVTSEENSIFEKQIFNISQVSIADLTFDILDINESIVINIKFDKNKFDCQVIDGIFDNFIDVLDTVLDNFDTTVETLVNKISDKDLHLLDQINRTKVEWPKVENLYTLFYDRLKENSYKTGIKFGDKSLSYSEIDRYINNLSNLLKKQGVSKNDIVLVHLKRSELLPIILVTLIKERICYVPLDTRLPLERKQTIAKVSNATFIIQGEDALDLSLENVTSVHIDNKVDPEDLSTSSQLSEKEVYIEEKQRTNDNVFILFTSGSTGEPKGAIITHSNLLNFYYAIKQEVDLQASDVFLALSTVSFDIAFTELVFPLLLGATTVVVSESDQVDGERLRGIIKKNNVDVLQCTPTTFKILLNSNEHFIVPNKVLSTGEALNKNTAMQLFANNSNLELFNMYGPTECTIETTIGKVINENAIHIGKPIANVQTYILDKQYKRVPVGIPGELYIAGLNVFDGYINKDLEKNRYLFAIPESFSSDYEYMYKTGDLVRVDEDGNLIYIERIDNQVKIRGYRIELDEIDIALMKNGIREVKTIIIDDKICVFFIPNGDHLNTENLNKKLKTLLPDYMIPNLYYEIDNMPISFNGKFDKKALINKSKQFKITETKPITANCVSNESILVQIRKIWEEVLQKEIVSDNLNFFDIGGNSLLILKLKEELENIAQTHLSTTQLFINSTIKSQNDMLLQFKEKTDTIHEIYREVDKTEIIENKKTEQYETAGYQVQFD